MASNETHNPVLLSDFDGTAVRLAGKLNPRNWLKYPLDGIPGYGDFLQGVRDSGVDIGGIVTRRPDIFPRRYVTERSVVKLGLERFFPGRESVVLEGSEAGKGAFVALKAHEERRPVGMIDDKPHRAGAAIVSAMGRIPLEPSDRILPVTLGVVNHARSEEYVTRFIEEVEAGQSETGIAVAESSQEQAFVLRGPDLRFRLNIVPLPEYSLEAGQEFGERLFGHCYA